MLCQPLSIYPDGIDELTFFQDVSLDKIEVLNTYNNLIEQGEYSKASVYINEQEGIFGYFACFFNLASTDAPISFTTFTAILQPPFLPFFPHQVSQHTPSI